eukprot:SAG31_NODE_1429_length_8390_cov_2.259076_8_plen_59_part_00
MGGQDEVVMFPQRRLSDGLVVNLDGSWTRRVESHFCFLVWVAGGCLRVCAKDKVVVDS